jgi:predicted transcriptional regulator
MALVESTVLELCKEDTAYTFSIHIINRILLALQEKGRINRTNLAGMAGINYKQCVKYVNLLLQFDWIRIASEDSHLIVTITEKGIDMIERLDRS